MQYLIVILLFFVSLPLSAKNAIPIVAQQHIYDDYLCLVKGREIKTINEYGGKCARREVTEVLLIQQILALGGFDYDFELEPGYYAQKDVKLLKSGMLLIGVDSFWSSQAKSLQKDVYITPALIEKGTYVAGLYTVEKNVKALSASTEQEIKKLSIISSKTWPVDWQLIQSLGFKNISHEVSWMTQAKLMKSKLVDIMLIPFSNEEDKSYVFLQTKFVPIPNIKISFPEGRHVLISKKHPLGKQAYEAFLKGMKIMKEKGAIEKAFNQSGLTREDVKDWPSL